VAQVWRSVEEGKHAVDARWSDVIDKLLDWERRAEAMKELERAWRRAIDKIAERASLTKARDTRR
jgi:hypothetical protein